MAAISSAVAVGVGSAYTAKRSADKQTKALRKGNDASVAEQRRQYDTTREDFAPWRAAGADALGQITGDNVLDNFFASPDYEFRRSEGMRDIGNQFAARGGGGNAMKALAGYNSNLAAGEYGNWFNRMFGISEAGRGAQGTVAHAGMNAANNISAGYMNTGANIAGVRGNQYSNINNALVGGISNVLYETQKVKPPATAPIGRGN